jgi:hypothetical protein
VFLWRISNHLSVAGDGALRTPGRWHPRGRRVVCGVHTQAATLLEIPVHFEMDIEELPVRYRLLKIDAPERRVERCVSRLSANRLAGQNRGDRALDAGSLTKGFPRPSCACRRRAFRDIQCPADPCSSGRQESASSRQESNVIDRRLLK